MTSSTITISKTEYNELLTIKEKHEHNVKLIEEVKKDLGNMVKKAD